MVVAGFFLFFPALTRELDALPKLWSSFVCLYGLGSFGKRGLFNVGMFVGRLVLAFFDGLSYVASEGSSSIGLVGGLLVGRE